MGRLLLRKLILSSMILCVLAFSLVVSVEASATTWSQTYGGTYGDFATSIVETSDGGYALIGSSGSVGALHRPWLVKTDEFGNMEWNKTYGEPTGDWAYTVIETTDEGYAIAALTTSLDGENTDFWLIKTDSSGNIEWDKQYGGATDEFPYSLIQTSDGGYALAGSVGHGFPGLELQDEDFWLVKTEASGNMQWNHTYGGAEMDIAYSLVATSDGGYALAGLTGSFGTEGNDFWLVKTDEFGNMVWNQTYERPPPESDFFFVPAFSLVATSDGGCTLAGCTGVFGGVDVCLIKTNSLGNVEWNQTYGGPDWDWVTSLAVTPDGGYALAGTTDSSGAGSYDFWLVKADDSGNMEWKQTYGGTEGERAFSLVVTSDGSYALAGVTDSFGSGSHDYWLVKTDGCIETTNDFVDYEFDFSYGYGEYVVVISTNSTVGGFDFGINQDRISFTVTGPTGTTGVAKIIIPEDLTDDEFPVYLNELMLLETANYTKTYNGTHTILDMTYSHSTHLIEITGTNVIPEYSSWLIPTLLLTATLFLMVSKRRLTNQRS